VGRGESEKRADNLWGDCPNTDPTRSLKSLRQGMKNLVKRASSSTLEGSGAEGTVACFPGLNDRARKKRCTGAQFSDSESIYIGAVEG